MSRFTEYLMNTEDSYTCISDYSVNEAGPVVETLIKILSHIMGAKKEVEGVINLIEDKQLKKHLKTFLISCVFITALLKSLT
jgi:hypothetical protein